MNRALRAATMGALLLTPVVLTACGAGQVNQTSSQDRDKVGARAEVGDLELRQVQLVNPCEADEDATAYEAGDNPELTLTVVNSGREDDTLTGLEGEAFDGVYVDELPSATTAPAPQPTTPTTSAPGTAGPGTTTRGTETPQTSGAPDTSDAPATGTVPTQAVPTPARPTATDDPDITIPAQSTVTIGLRQYEPNSPCDPQVEADVPRLFLADLDVDRDAPLTASQTVMMTFTFANAGEVTVAATVAGPYGAVERGEGFDFQEHEGADAGDEQDSESE